MSQTVGWDKAAEAAGPPICKLRGGPALASLAGPTLLAIFAATAGAAPPKVNYLFPAGAQRGQTASVTASGEFSNWPVQVWADRPGLTATCEKDKGKLKVEVAADAVPGTYWLRLYDSEGAAVMRPFVVGTLPEVTEDETNDLPVKPQAVDARVVVNGRLAKSGDLDGYRVELKQGQTLVAAVQGHSILGSPMDSVLQICELLERRSSSAVSTKVETEAFVLEQNHDAIGLDPQIAFSAPRDGQYLVRLFAFPSEPDSSIRFAGGDAFIYRLTLTTGGFIDHALPLAVGAETANVRLVGWNIPEALLAFAVPSVADPLTHRIFHPDLAGAVELPRLEQPCILGDDAASLDKPQTVSLPVTIGWRLEKAGDADAYAFQAAKGDKVHIEVEAHALGFPTDATLAVLDDAGRALAEADDTGREQRDPQIDFTAPEEGRYRVAIRDLAGRGGPRIAYRLTIEPQAPGFSLSLAADSFVLDKDKPLEIQVNVAAQNGFREEVEIQAIGLPPGVTAEPIKFTPSGERGNSGGSGRRGRRGGSGDQNSGQGVKLVLKGDPALVEAGGWPIRIEGRTGSEQPLVRTAEFPLNLPLAGSHHAAWLTIRK
ncbi:MAG TPA: PPC domain-containing protein [Pirellulaceae bacterium]|nr:PPC domain-containing protein [Pirellulaceae bacterium]